MSARRVREAVLAVLFGPAAFGFARGASAQVCTELGLPNPVYGTRNGVEGGTLRQLAAYLAGLRRAMQVEREGLLGALASYAAPDPCACFFEAIATGRESCARCETDSDCEADGARCRRAFGEAH